MHRTIDRFFTHLSVGKVVAVAFESHSYAAVWIVVLWVVTSMVWAAIPCLLTQSLKLILLSLKDLGMTRLPDSLDEISSFFVDLLIYPLFKIIHTCIPLVCTYLYGAVNGSNSSVSQLPLCFSDYLNSLVCFDVTFKLRTGRCNFLD